MKANNNIHPNLDSTNIVNTIKEVLAPTFVLPIATFMDGEKTKKTIENILDKCHRDFTKKNARIALGINWTEIDPLLTEIIEKRFVVA